MPSDPSPSALRAVFDDAVELPPDQREPFLETSCHGDAKLRAAVESLLAAHDRAGSFLANPLIMPDLLQAREQLSPGIRVGRYVLLHVLGEGGWGIVHLAEQDPPLRRRVALKVVKPGMDSRQVMARFELERQALALMDHPNIAKVFDAGSTAAGHPYFAMEFVDGTPITQFCVSHQLDLNARLQLFKIVCAAVHHAHERGILHRDLKPGNVLVFLQDGTPMPKVIDFGIAKALAPDASGAAATIELQLLGTPQYMSPEQALGGSAPVDWRSDVYSLGALLYELLTDTPPFDRDQLRFSALADLGRVLREVEPPAPSARLAQFDFAPPHIAIRQAEAQKRLPQVRGNLDRIVSKAMQKDANRRYESAAALASDIQRHLEGEPIIAPRPHWFGNVLPSALRYRGILTVVMLVVACFILSGAVWNQLHPPAPAVVYSDVPLQAGLTAELYSGQFQTLAGRRIDSQIDFFWPRGKSPGPAIRPPHFSIIWRGILVIPPGGILGIGTEADDGSWLFIDGHKLVAFGRPARVISHSVLPAGRHVIEVRYWNRVGPGSIKLLWLRSPDDVDAQVVPVDALFHE